MPSSNGQDHASRPTADRPAKAHPPPAPKQQQPTSPEKSKDIHGDPETPV